MWGDVRVRNCSGSNAGAKKQGQIFACKVSELASRLQSRPLRPERWYPLPRSLASLWTLRAPREVTKGSNTLQLHSAFLHSTRERRD